jgi:subtilase family serine protease
MSLGRWKQVRRSCKLVVLLAGVYAGLPMAAQNGSPVQPRITQAIDGDNRVRIAGSVRPAIAHATDLGAVRPNLPLERMVLVLTPAAGQAAALTQLLDDQQNAASPSYHRWLTPQQFAQGYGPAAADVQQVQGWLQSQGLAVTRVANGGWWIQFSGTAAQVSQAFGTSIHQYSMNGEMHTANASEISLPAALSPVVAGVLSLNDFPKLPNHTQVRRVARSSTGELRPVGEIARLGIQPDGTFGGGTHYLAPGDLAAIYDTNPLLKQGIAGRGVSIAVLGQTDVQLADIESFRNIFHLPANDPKILVDGTDPGFSSGDEEESDLDLEYAGALAPQANVVFVTSASTLTTSGIDLSAAYAVDNVVAPIVTLSYGECEANLNTAGNAFENQLWAQAAAEGITVFVSSGDSGAANCDAGGQTYDAVFGLMVNGLSSTPYNVSVGGTTLAEGASASTYWGGQNGAGYASAIGYIPETVWNDSCDVASFPYGCAYTGGQAYLSGGGGGASGCLTSTFGIAGYSCSGAYAKPAWQTGPGVPADGRRDLPDLALASSAEHDGYLICNEGSCQTIYQNGAVTLESASIIGGTSASTPAMAGIMALVEQKNGGFQGQANYTLYKLAAQQNTSACNSSNLTSPGTANGCVFHDVTAGSNAVPCYGSSPNCSSSLNGVNGVLTGYAAGSGYDQASGLGSVDASNLASVWASVGLAASTTQLKLGTVSAVHGQPVAVTGLVQAATGTGTPTGNLSLNAGGQAFGPFSLTSGGYSGSVSSLPGGTYGVSAYYAGDATYAASASTPSSITITPESSKVGLQLYYYNYATNRTGPVTGPVEFGAPLYYQATVQGVSGQGVPTGSVSFTQDSSPLGSYTLNSGGQAALDYSLVSLPNVLPGSHTIAASYAGDNSFQTGVSAGVPITISQGQVSTFAIPNVTSVVKGQPVEINLALGAGYTTQPLPTGTVQLYDNGVALGQRLTVTSTGVQGNGYPQAVYNTSSLAVGTHKLTASYSGDTYYAAVPQTSNNAISSTIAVTASSAAANSVTLTASASSVSVGQSVQYTVHIVPAAANGPVPTGTVTLMDPTPTYPFTFTIAPATQLANGAITFTETFYGSGSLQVYASYSGDSNYAPSVSPVALTVYNTIAPTAQLSANAAYTLPGTQSSIAVQVTGRPNLPAYPVPTGPVQFFDSFNGAPAKPLATQYLSMGNGNLGVDTLPLTLAAGSHTITAQYGGDNVWSPIAMAPVTVVVTQPDFNVTTPAGDTPVTLGSAGTATLTATPELAYSGTISFACTGGVPLGASCSFAPGMVGTAGGAASSSLILATTAPSAQEASLTGAGSAATLRWASCSALACILLLGCARRGARLRLLPVLLLCFVFGMSGCSGGPSVPTAVALVSDFGAKAALGSNVSFTAVVSGDRAAAGGTVTFLDGQTTLATVTVSAAKANFETTSLALGTHAITAVFHPATGGTTASSAVLGQGITGVAQVQVTAVSGQLSHIVTVGYLLQ